MDQKMCQKFSLLVVWMFLAPVALGHDGHIRRPSQNDAMWGHQIPVNYKILPRPETKLHQEPTHLYVAPPAMIESKPVEPYAYGWFGAKSSPHWYRQFGHQKAYTQWTLR